jgi:glucose-1-phosphate thymidylyltransferase
MKGIILAGGSGTRLYPMTIVVNKHLLPIYNKPMIYYPLSVLMLANIRDIMIISTPEDTSNFKQMLGTGERFGINLQYEIQPTPDGLAQAFLIAEDFIGDDNVAMILGDNIFVGSGLSERLIKATENVRNGKATIFGYYVNDPERFGVIEFDDGGKVISLEEKPKVPRSNYAATGLYFYDNNVVEFAKQVKPSWRNELEITDLNNIYLSKHNLEAIPLDRGYTWMDAGTPDSLAEATRFIQSLEKHQGLKIACLEEIGYHKGWISRDNLEQIVSNYAKSDYGNYLAKVLAGRIIYKN